MTDDAPALRAAVAAIGRNNGTLRIGPGVYRLASALTIPRNVSLSVEGGVIAVDVGLVKIASPHPINVRWFGANGTSAAQVGAIVEGSAQLTLDATVFLAAGNVLRISGAGAEGADLTARALSIRGHTVTLDAVARTSVSDARVTPSDDVCIQQALDCHPTASWFYRVYIPLGWYRLHAGLTVPDGNVVIAGDGRKISALGAESGVSDNVLTVHGGTTIRGLFIMPALGGGVSNDFVVNDNLIDDCWFYGGGGSAPMVSGVCHNETITRCVFEHCERAVDLPGVNYLNMSDCIFYDVFTSGIRTTAGGHGLNLSNLQFEAVNVSPDAEALVSIDGYTAVNMSNIIVRHLADGRYATPVGITNCTGFMASVMIDGGLTVFR